MGRKVTSGVAGGSGLGALNIVSSTITSTTANADITLAPNGTGDVFFNADTIRLGDQNVDATLTTWGTSDAIINTNSGSNSGSIRIYDGANGNIALEPNGTGTIQLGTSATTPVTIAGAATINSASITANTVSSNTTSGALVVTGGVGIGGALNVAGTATVDTPTLSGHAATKDYVDTQVGGTWTTISSSTTAVNLTNYFVDTRTAPITLTLPGSPTANSKVAVADLAGSFDVNNLILARNGVLIMGRTEDLVINVRNASITLVYSGATFGWKLV